MVEYIPYVLRISKFVTLKIFYQSDTLTFTAKSYSSKSVVELYSPKLLYPKVLLLTFMTCVLVWGKGILAISLLILNILLLIRFTFSYEETQ